MFTFSSSQSRTSIFVSQRPITEFDFGGKIFVDRATLYFRGRTTISGLSRSEVVDIFGAVDSLLTTDVDSAVVSMDLGSQGGRLGSQVS